MKKIALYILILLEAALIISIMVIERAYRGSGSTEWIDAGYSIMRYLWIPMLFFVICLIVATFIRERVALRIFVGMLAIAGIIIFNKIYLFPF